MRKRDKQSMFNRVWKGVIAQGGPATDEEAGGCVYRTSDGRKCAAGLLFTDEEHETIAKHYEQTATFPRLVDLHIITRPVLVRGADFVAQLQHIHDGAALNTDVEEFMTRFTRDMRCLAHDHGLEVPE